MKKVESINKVNHELVHTLKRLLGQASSGKLRSVIFVDLYVDGKCGHGWDGVPNMQMIGELESAKLRYLSQVTPLGEES